MLPPPGGGPRRGGGGSGTKPYSKGLNTLKYYMSCSGGLSPCPPPHLYIAMTTPGGNSCRVSAVPSRQSRISTRDLVADNSKVENRKKKQFERQVTPLGLGQRWPRAAATWLSPRRLYQSPLSSSSQPCPNPTLHLAIRARYRR